MGFNSSLSSAERDKRALEWKSYTEDRKKLEKKLYGDPFHSSPRWLQLRYDTLKKYEGRCQCCGARPSDVNPLQVDHIKPRSKYPNLALDPNNVQVLCRDCNIGKGARDETDWRCA